MFSQWLQLSRYTQIPQNVNDKETFEENEDSSWIVHLRCKKFQSFVCLIGLGLVIGLTSFALGLKVARCQSNHLILSDTINQVSIGWSRETFHYNESFARSPPESGDSEPIWDSLIPNGLGYIKHPNLAPNLSVISAFHQLHCLYTLRRAYYSTSEPGELEDFDFGLNRTSHTSHCFEYLRQSLMCSADPSIEPADTGVDGFLGWGFQRQCRNFVELKDWAEDSRVFEGHGFLAADIVHNHGSQNP